MTSAATDGQAKPTGLSGDWLGLVAAAALSVAVMVLFYPGISTYDTYEWITQARRGSLSDIQPPGSMWFLSFSEWLVPGPYPFVVFNILLIVFSIYAIVRLTIESSQARIAILLATVLYPPVLGIMGVAWRDLTGLGITLATIAMALFVVRTPSSNGRITGAVAAIALTAIGVAFRDNQAASALPSLLVILYTLLPSRFSPIYKVLAAGAGALLTCIAITLGMWAFINALVTVRSYKSQPHGNYLLARMSQVEGRNLFPVACYPNLDMTAVGRFLQANGERAAPLIFRDWNRRDATLFPVFDSEAEILRCRGLVNAAVGAHTSARVSVSLQDMMYLAVPWRSWRGNTAVLASAPLEPAFHPIELNFPQAMSGWRTAVLRLLKEFNNFTIFNNPWPMALLACGLAGLVVRRLPSRSSLWHGELRGPTAGADRHLIALGLLISTALCHLLPVLLTVSFTDFRWVHQSIALLLLACTLAAHFLTTRVEQP